MGQKNLAILTGWPYYRGRVKFHELRAVMTNTGRNFFYGWRLTGDGWRVAGGGWRVAGDRNIYIKNLKKGYVQFVKKKYHENGKAT